MKCNHQHRLVTVLSVLVLWMAGCAQPTTVDKVVKETEIVVTPTATAPPTDTHTPTATIKTTPTPTPAVEEFECTDAIGCVDVGASDPILVGYVLDLSGPMEGPAMLSRRGIEMALDDQPEVLGHPVELVGEDSLCHPDFATMAADDMVDLYPSLVGAIGTTCNRTAEPAAEILSDAGMVLISPSYWAPSLTSLEGQHWYLRTAHNDVAEGERMAEFARDYLDVSRAATIHDGSLDAKVTEESFANTFFWLGGTITAQIEVEDPEFIREALMEIADSSPDILYYPIDLNMGERVTREAKKITALENTQLAGASALFSSDFVGGAGSAAEGMHISGPNRVSREDVTFDEAHAYDATMILLDAIEKVGVQDEDGTLHIGRKALRDALFATEGHEGITGTLTCDEDGDCADPQAIGIYKIQNGEFVGWWPCWFVDCEECRHRCVQSECADDVCPRCVDCCHIDC